VVLHAVAVAAVLGSSLLVWFGAGGLPTTVAAILPALVCVALVAAGAWIRARAPEEPAAGVFWGAGVLAAVPAVLGLAPMLELFTPPSRFEVQLLASPPLLNAWLALAFGVALLLSGAALFFTRRTFFAWTTAIFAAAAYTGFLLTHNLLSMPPHKMALWLSPLVLLAAPGLLCESQGRVRWAVPFHVVAILALVGCVDAMALHGQLFHMVRLDQLLAASRLPYLGFAFSGLLLLAVTFGLERTSSLDLRDGARYLRAVASIHLLAGLYANAAANGAWRDVLAYMGAVGLLLVLGRRRRALALMGLLGLAVGCYLVLDLGLAGTAVFTLVLAVGGLLATFATYAWLRRRGAAPAPDEAESSLEVVSFE